MRLLSRNSDGDFCLTRPLARANRPFYAILSHTWGSDADEVTFQDITEGTGKNKEGYDKLRFCADQALRDGLIYFWVDTCCINKADSSELHEAINSMFDWYRNAARCYVFLSDVWNNTNIHSRVLHGAPWESSFRASRWFSRGWTLQELLAPASVYFFAQNGTFIGDKESLQKLIFGITGIPVSALRGDPLADFDIEERFQWAECRQTTREEDWAYALLGIFGVFISPIYGEGRRNAIRRLRREINDVLRAEVEITPVRREVLPIRQKNTMHTQNRDTKGIPEIAVPIECLRTIKAHYGYVKALTFSPDSRLLASGAENLKLWDPVTGEPEEDLPSSLVVAHSITFSPDSRLLASAQKAIDIWNVVTRQHLHTLADHQDGVESVAFSPDSRLLASASTDKTVKLWNPATGRCLHTLTGHAREVNSVAFSPDARLLASASTDDTVKIWDPVTARCLHTLTEHRNTVTSVAFSPDGHRFASASIDKTIKLWDPVTMKCLHTLEEHQENIRSVTFSPDSRLLASASNDKTIKLWDVATGDCLQTLTGHQSDVLAVAFSPDSRFLASSSMEIVKIWG